MSLPHHHILPPTLAATAALALLSACRQDDTPAPAPKARVSLYASTQRLVPDGAAHAPAVSPRKAPATTADYTPLMVDEQDAVAITLLFVSHDDPTEQTIKNFFWSSNNTTPAVTLWEPAAAIDEGSYDVYGFMPAVAATACTLIPADADHGPRLTLNGLSAATPQDVCCVVGVAREPDNTKFILGTGSQDVEPGSYSFTAEEGNNTMYVLMHHLFARLTLSYSVSEAYSRLRTIRLRSVSVAMRHGTVNATITLPTATSALSATFEAAAGATAAEQTFFTGDMELTTTPQVVSAFLAPMNTAEDRRLTLSSTYDVYDTKGALVRADCHATNTWSIAPTLTPGDSYAISAVVDPTYLYQLSGNDLDNLIALSN
ncbi:MAG: hypothetical protein K5928_00745 [Prevotella sp.]|nr:hypothetical protein [Prevotella sp.]